MSKWGSKRRTGRLVTAVLLSVCVLVEGLPGSAEAAEEVARPAAREASELPALESTAGEEPSELVPSDGRPPGVGTDEFSMDGAELVDQTATTDVYENDGLRMARVYSETVNFQDDQGRWAKIDPTLQTQEDGTLRNAAGPFVVELEGSSAGKGLASMSGKGWSLSFGPDRSEDERGLTDASPDDRAGERVEDAPAADVPQGEVSTTTSLDAEVKELPGDKEPLRAGVPNETSVRYDGLEPGVGLRYTVTSSSLKEEIVLDEPLDATHPGTWRFELDLIGLVAKPDDAGGIGFYLGDGSLVATMPDGVASDEKTDAMRGTGTSFVDVRLIEEEGRQLVEVVPDRKWLDDPQRAYPISIDPTTHVVNNAAVSDAYTGNGCLNCNYNGQAGPGQYQMGQVENNAYMNRVGYPGYYGWEYYSYVSYGGLSSLAGKDIISATWKVEFYDTDPSSGAYFRMYPVSEAWSHETVSWATRPNHRAEYIDGVATAGQYATDITQWVSNWTATSGGWANYGVAIDTAGEDSFLRFYAAEQSWQAGRAPRIEVVYSTQPPASVLSSPASGTRITTARPTLSTNSVTDPDQTPDAVLYKFRVATGTDAKSGQIVDSPWQSGTTWTVPEGVLKDGVTYYWRVYTKDAYTDPANPPTQSGSPWSFKIDLGLGDEPTTAFDAVGSTMVNLANGNLVLQTASPSIPVVGGSLGVSYTYNSQAPLERG